MYLSNSVISKVTFAIATLFILTGCSSDEFTSENIKNDWEYKDFHYFNLTPKQTEYSQIQIETGFKYFSDLAKLCSANSDYENFAFSPLSADMTLSMFANALDSDVSGFDELLRNIGCDDFDDFNQYNWRLMTDMPFNEESSEALMLTNGIWYNNRYNVNKGFADLMQSKYLVTPLARDFSKQKELKSEINEWAYRNSAGNIKDFLKDSEALPNSIFIANTLYFRAKWDYKFKKSETLNEEFSGYFEKVKVPMMRKSFTSFASVGLDGSTMVEVPFEKLGYIVFILPPEETDIYEYAGNFTVDKYNELYFSEQGCTHIVNIRVPRMKYESDIDFSDILKQNNVLLWEKFSCIGLGSTDRLINLKQATAIEFDEEGITGAAVTGTLGVTFNPGEIPPKIDFFLNRPFIYFIRERNTGTILMAGLVSQL